MNENYSNEDALDVEEEIGNEDVSIESPFNPNEINIKIMPYTIGQLVDRLNYDEILIPKYQRIANLWNEKKKSRFIESLMLNLPIPLFYFDNQDDGVWRVVDGLQRVSTIEHFMSSKSAIAQNSSPLILTDLEFLKDYEGMTWEDLPRDMKRKINGFQITINLIDKGTPEEVKYNIFSRINQGGEPLKPQEIRTALFQGYKVELLESLVSKSNGIGKSFYKAVSNSVKTSRQDDLDFANRFVAFYILGFEKYKPDMDTFLTDGLKELKQGSILNQIKQDFKSAMDLAFDIFGNDAFRKRKNLGDPRKPINKPLFEVISVHFSRLNEENKKKLVKNKKKFIVEFIDLQKNPSDQSFWNSLTTGTATKESVQNRHKTFERLLNKYIENDKSI